MPQTADAITARPPELDTANPLVALAGYLEALDTRLAALEALSEPEPLMTLKDAADYAQAATKTLQRAIQARELPTVGYIGRSPRLCREDIDHWLAQQRPHARRASRQPRRKSAITSTNPPVEAAWSELE